MTDDEAGRLLRALLARYTPGAVLHLLADALAGDAAAAGWPDGDPRHARLAAVRDALFVVGLGVDAARPD